MANKRSTSLEDVSKKALRIHILDPDEWESKYVSKIEDASLHPEYGALILSTLQIAVIDKFSPAPSLGDVIRYVADLRLQLGEHAGMLNPLLAEKAIRSLLGDDALKEVPPFGENPEDMLSTALLLLASLVAEAGLDESGVDELINEATDNAEKINWSSLPIGQRTGSPPLQGGSDTAAGAASILNANPGPSRGVGGSWKGS
ncbi:hypothetical protein F4557_004632 [Actinomadura catellatispora]|uniref:Uncharacterized protein n=1 Tax=Actinomadura livida TaxID=79909 RepID=A0A7W7IFL6_9ACTN|nr:hypothetical protein [Actinomadura catellatispora]